MNFNTNIRSLAGAAVIATAAMASPAAAGVVTFSNVTGTWSAASPSGAVTYSGNGTSTAKASWGTPTENNKKSSYTFTGTPFGPVDLDPGESSGDFILGNFQHSNWPITGTSLTSINLLFSAKIYVDGQYFDTKTFTFYFDHEETPNGSNGDRCPYGGTKVGQTGINKNGCADKVDVNYNKLANTFDVNGDKYSLEIAGWLVNGVKATSFLTKEKYDNQAQIMGKITMISSAVPEPSTWAMMIVGFGAVGAMVRSTRRRNAAVTA